MEAQKKGIRSFDMKHSILTPFLVFFFFKPDWLELFLEKDEYTEIDDLAALLASLKRIKENPTELEEYDPELAYSPF